MTLVIKVRAENMGTQRKEKDEKAIEIARSRIW
jgi:hypothetical protein